MRIKIGRPRLRLTHWLVGLSLICVTYMFYSKHTGYTERCYGCERDNKNIPAGFEMMTTTALIEAAVNESVPVFVYQYNSSKTWHHLINCSNIHEVSLGKKLGNGVSKVTYDGQFRGRPVAVKMVTADVEDIKNCIDKLPGRKNYKEKDNTNKDCFIFPNMKLLKEILMAIQLDHPGVIKLLGYCVRHEETVQNPDLKHHGVVAVYEKAKPINKKDQKSVAIETNIDLSLQLLNLLYFLDHSPLGSVAVQDLKTSNMMVVGGQIKLSDLDDVNSMVAKCSSSKKCLYGTPCIAGRCTKENAALNMVRATEAFLKTALLCSKCSQKDALQALVRDMAAGTIKAESAALRLKEIQAKL